MRDILFRGKDKDTGKWYEGAYRQYEDTTYCFKEDFDRHTENVHHTIIFSRMVDWGLPNQHLQAEVMPETVGQYIGKTDINHKRIFEGDEIKLLAYGGEICVVEYNSNAAAFVLRGAELTYSLEIFPDGTLEVVGNIYDKYGCKHIDDPNWNKWSCGDCGDYYKKCGCRGPKGILNGKK